MEPSDREIRDFWDRNPVNADFIRSEDATGRRFFEEYDRRRGETEPHVRAELLELDLRGKRVLEIGLGAGGSLQGSGGTSGCSRGSR